MTSIPNLRPHRKPQPVEAPAPEHLPSVIEALLFVAEEPVELTALSRNLGVTRARLEKAIEELGERLRERGIRLQVTGEVAQLVSAPEWAGHVERFLGMEYPRLSDAALETLAIIAYRQPVTRAVIESIRGVNADGAIATLLHRGLVQEVGRAETVGRPVLFGTTVRFLEHFGLEKPEDIPALPGEPEAEPETMEL